MSIHQLLKAQLNALHASSASLQQLQERYQQKRPTGPKTTEEFTAYVLGRMPATLAALDEVLAQIPSPFLEKLTTVLDIGAGPGTSLWAFQNSCPNLEHMTLLEREPPFIEIGARLARPLSTSFQYVQQDAMTAAFQSADLILLSYSLNEFLQQESLLTKAWEVAQHGLLIVEPGTPKGFENIRRARAQLMALGGFVSVPCGHNAPCPMVAGDWCHFSVRLQRFNAQQQIKKGALGYEDEKFSYVLMTKETLPALGERILKNPHRGGGHVSFDLCTHTGVQKKTVSRREVRYAAARHLDWGDVL